MTSIPFGGLKRGSRLISPCSHVEMTSIPFGGLKPDAYIDALAGVVHVEMTSIPFGGLKPGGTTKANTNPRTMTSRNDINPLRGTET